LLWPRVKDLVAFPDLRSLTARPVLDALPMCVIVLVQVRKFVFL